MNTYNGLPESLPKKDGIYVVLLDYYPDRPFLAFYSVQRKLFSCTARGSAVNFRIFDKWDDFPALPLFINRGFVLYNGEDFEEGTELIVQDAVGTRYRGVVKMTPSGSYFVFNEDDYPVCRITSKCKYVNISSINWDE